MKRTLNKIINDQLKKKRQEVSQTKRQPSAYSSKIGLKSQVTANQYQSNRYSLKTSRLRLSQGMTQYGYDSRTYRSPLKSNKTSQQPPQTALKSNHSQSRLYRDTSPSKFQTLAAANNRRLQKKFTTTTLDRNFFLNSNLNNNQKSARNLNGMQNSVKRTQTQLGKQSVMSPTKIINTQRTNSKS